MSLSNFIGNKSNDKTQSTGGFSQLEPGVHTVTVGEAIFRKKGVDGEIHPDQVDQSCYLQIEFKDEVLNKTHMERISLVTSDKMTERYNFSPKKGAPEIAGLAQASPAEQVKFKMLLILDVLNKKYFNATVERKEDAKTFITPSVITIAKAVKFAFNEIKGKQIVIKVIGKAGKPNPATGVVSMNYSLSQNSKLVVNLQTYDIDPRFSSYSYPISLPNENKLTYTDYEKGLFEIEKTKITHNSTGVSNAQSKYATSANKPEQFGVNTGSESVNSFANGSSATDDLPF